MSDTEQCESFDLLPNRLAVVPFGAEEIHALVGSDNQYETCLLASNFNWIAAYLCEEVGIFEEEVADWFRGEAKGLDGDSPMDVWRANDGFWKVFEYAQLYKEQVDKDLAGEDMGEPDVPRSRELGKNALEVILKSFEVAGVDISACEEDPEYTRVRYIHNPHRENSPIVRWKGNQTMEDYRITIDEGPRQATFFIVRYLPKDEAPMILQTGIGRYGRMLGDNQPVEVDSDLDGRPPSAGEVASFVIPVANETQNRSFKPLLA